MKPPQLPTEISPDGAEIWDWAGKASEFIQLQQKLRELRSKIIRSTCSCGSCDKWMKSRECPREKNIGGMSRGPSMGAAKCSEFVQSDSSIRLQEQWKDELAALTPTETKEKR